ncbi:MAG: DUF1028 domain-containing protein [Planctomycetota bacterium]|nr:MAG: DUF1028 domain-containing protein [Planctomycetota bacterium]
MKHPIDVLRRVARCSGVGLILALLSVNALATWSIVVIRKSTGEVCVASATCLANFQLGVFLPVVVVGKGVGAAQSFVDFSGTNRVRIWDGIHAGWTPQRILEQLAALDSGHQTRQYGIVSCDGPPVTFTGTGAGVAKFGVVGDIDGDIIYAIQGNVLAGEAVVLAAEHALRGAPGDLGQRVMAAMEAARSFGGDGRCSCSSSQPASCGSPPPSFTHSAFTAFIMLARVGDAEGVCNGSVGCANGSYYLDKKFIGNASDLDPVVMLQMRYDIWRANRAGAPDHILTERLLGAQSLVADGISGTAVTLRLVDIEGDALTVGGQTVTITQVNADPPVAIPGPVVDNGDGTHTFSLTATTNPGTGVWRIVVQQGTAVVQLFPDLTLAVDSVSDLHLGFHEVSASAAPSVPVVLNLPGDPGRPYHLLGSASGTTPGTAWPGGGTLPLNRDRLLGFTYVAPGPPTLPGSVGVLDSAGRAEASIAFDTVALFPFIGGRFDFCAVLAGAPDDFTDVSGFDIVP